MKTTINRAEALKRLGVIEEEAKLLRKHLTTSDNVMERVTNLKEACEELGRDEATIFGSETDPYKRAQIAIETFAEAMREGKSASECYYYPYFNRSSGVCFSSGVYVDDLGYSTVGARLRVDTGDKAKHMGKCMLDEYNIYLQG